MHRLIAFSYEALLAAVGTTFPTLRCWSSMIRPPVQLTLRQCKLYCEHPATQCSRRPIVHGCEPIVVTRNRGVACGFARRSGVRGGVSPVPLPTLLYDS